MAEPIGLRVAKASPEQVEGLRQWFHELEEILDSTVIWDPTGKAGQFISETFRSRRIDEYERVLLGYTTLVENVCDPALNYLDFKPEIKAAIEAWKERGLI